MAEYWALLNQVRQDLGKSYTIAEEHTANVLRLNLLVRRQRRDETLTVVVDTRWLVALAGDQHTAWGEYRRLITMIGNFFANPDALPAQSFEWPGTAQGREDLRRTLSRRRRSQTA